MSRQRNPRPEFKVCRICGRELPNTHEYFEWSHRDLNYLQTFCRECSAKRNREKYERMMQDPKKYEAYKAKSREKENKKHRSNGALEKQPISEYSQEYAARWQKNKAENIPAYKREKQLRRALRRVVLSQGKNNVTRSTLVDIVGMPIRDLHYYLLRTFEETYGYPWDGVEKTHVDHIIPLCTESTIEGKEKLFHYSNLRLIKAKDNRAKWTSVDYPLGERVKSEDIIKKYGGLPT